MALSMILLYALLFVLFSCNSADILARCTWLLQLMAKPARADTMQAEMHLRFRKILRHGSINLMPTYYTQVPRPEDDERLNCFSKCCT